MREIKFRAWDKTFKKMVPIEICRFISPITLQDYELLQYTGLKDKNGKEIYEGDIVHQFGGKNHLVEFRDCAFRCSGFPLNEFHSSEVIGNIYENPNLLGEVDESH